LSSGCRPTCRSRPRAPRSLSKDDWIKEDGARLRHENAVEPLEELALVACAEPFDRRFVHVDETHETDRVLDELRMRFEVRADVRDAVRSQLVERGLHG
jgi:hypothetical protein